MLDTLASTTATTSDEFGNQTFLGRVLSRVAMWLGDAKNGLAEVFVGKVNTKELCVSDDTGSKTCLNKTQIDKILNNPGSPNGEPNRQSAAVSSSTSSTTATTTPTGDTKDTVAPVVTLTGDQSITLSVGASYIDPGATVTDNVDQNLGVKATVDGGAKGDISSISIDTSTSSVHTITFSATDGAGNASVPVIRKVTVQ